MCLSSLKYIKSKLGKSSYMLHTWKYSEHRAIYNIPPMDTGSWWVLMTSWSWSGVRCQKLSTIVLAKKLQLFHHKILINPLHQAINKWIIEEKNIFLISTDRVRLPCQLVFIRDVRKPVRTVCFKKRLSLQEDRIELAWGGELCSKHSQPQGFCLVARDWNYIKQRHVSGLVY